MKAKLRELPEEKLEKITISKNDIGKLDSDQKEIELNGKMYDIAKVVKQGDDFIIYALPDKSEDDLLSFLDELVRQSNNDKKPIPSQLLEFFSLVFIKTQNNFSFCQESHQRHFFSYCNLYTSIRASIQSPPPQG
jgi:hypothetical protein